jgi:hypothetical protein
VLDRIVAAAITLLIVLDVIPETWREGGPASLLFAAVGLFGPTLLELSRSARLHAHFGALGLAMGGLVVHALGDGIALAPNAATSRALQLAIPLHTVPVSMAVWSVLVPAAGVRGAASALAAMALATVAGYLYGIPLSELLGGRGWAWLQALIAGSILHVVFGRPHLHGGATHEHRLM